MDQMTDQQREEAIDLAAMKLHTATTQQSRREAWVELSKLVAGRSPKRITEMEAEKGLTPSPIDR